MNYLQIVQVFRRTPDPMLGTAKQNAPANYLFGCVLMLVLGKPCVKK
jgi:hypothetical protein